jgi:hypothetical protein
MHNSPCDFFPGDARDDQRLHLRVVWKGVQEQALPHVPHQACAQRRKGEESRPAFPNMLAMLKKVFISFFLSMQYLCMDCGKEFRQASGYRQHRKMKHSVIPPERYEWFLAESYCGFKLSVCHRN